jgi:hypothetical protein
VTKKKSRRNRGGRIGQADQVLRERLLAQGKTVISTPRGVRKISEVFLEFSEPFLAHYRREGRVTRRDVEDVLRMTMLVWNAVLVPDGDDLLRQLDAALAEAPEVRREAGVLVESRRTTYAQDRRMIGDFQVTPGARGDMRITVASAELPMPA